VKNLTSKSPWWIGAALWLTATMAWAQPGTFLPMQVGNFWSQELAHGNGDKIVRGPMNLLHAVHHSAMSWVPPNHIAMQQVIYRASANGVNWTSQVTLGQGTLPAIAVDHSSRVGIVFVRNGMIHYGHKTLGQPSFTVASLNQAGTDPAIVAHGNRVYVTWATGNGNEVRYTSFPTAAPPLTVAYETLVTTSCPNTVYSRPSISLLGDLCTKDVWPVVGFLVAANDLGSSSLCAVPLTYVGAQVRERVPLSGWTTTFTDVRLGAAPVRAHSLSVSAATFEKEVFVAWSDDIGGSYGPRTRLARGLAGNYATVAVTSTASHAHVRAANDLLFPFGRFRLTWVDFPFWDYNGWLREGYWWNAPTPTWQTLTHNLAAWSGVPARPQALFWESIRTPNRQQLAAYYERAQSPNPGVNPEFVGLYRMPDEPWRRRMGIDCIRPHGNDNPIHVAARTISGEGGETSEAWVDFGATGRVVDVFDTGLEIQLISGGTVQVTWPESATMLSAFEDGFVVAAAPTDLSFTSDDASFEVVDQGQLPEDPVFTTLTCNAELGECPEAP
jgi:hypothetical protein